MMTYRSLSTGLKTSCPQPKNWEGKTGRKTGEKLGTQYIFTCFCREKTGDAKNWPKTENFLMTSGDKKVFIHLDCPL